MGNFIFILVGAVCIGLVFWGGVWVGRRWGGHIVGDDAHIVPKGYDSFQRDDKNATVSEFAGGAQDFAALCRRDDEGIVPYGEERSAQERTKLEIILRNIDSYDGTAIGQEDVE